MSRRLMWIVPFAVLVLVACKGTPIPPVADAGPTIPAPQVCAADNECEGYNPANPRVRCDGICIYLCNGINEECDGIPNGDLRYCDGDGVCSFGCRASSACANADELCIDGVCRVASTECTSRCDCDAGEVCTGGVCQQPESTTCQSGEDCPRGPRSPVDNCVAVACNGVSDTCFEPAPAPCAVAADCTGRFGCTGGATCACNNQRCVPSASCTPQNEATTCGADNYCQALSSCTQPSDCTLAGLACNAGTARCERSKACTVSADCTVAPNSFCPAGGGFCAIASCLNGGVTCAGGQECSSQGRCVNPGLGACVGDGQCAANAYCDVTASECRLGCRNNASCPSGQDCGGDRQCTSSGGGLGYGETCGADEDCRAPMICGVSGTCAETCGTAADCNACNAAHGACSCNAVLIFGNFCRP